MLTLNSTHWVRSGRWLSFAMLVLLHLAMWLGINNTWARPLLLTHLGLFLMWQPLWRSETKLGWGDTTFILVVSLSALFWLNWWLVAFWVSGLFALVGGRVFSFYSRWQRMYYLLVMSYLLSLLLLYIAPRLIGLMTFEEVGNNVMGYALPLLLVVMALIPVERDRAESAQAVDFVYVLLLFTLMTMLVLGSLSFMTLGHIGYLDALLRTLFIIAIALFVLGVLWNPHLGFAGLQAAFTRYVLSMGTPLEEWLQRISTAARHEQNPDAFLDRAMSFLVEMPWITGLAWTSDEGRGMLGEMTPNSVELIEEDLGVTLFLRQAYSPTVLVHLRLLIQVMGNFYQAKRREQRLQEMTRQQAIYETGSRLTHDLKNMLQSLFTLTSVAQHDATKAQPILKQQLPVLTERIETLLTKLKAPETNIDEVKMPLQLWWDTLRQRHQHRNIEWVWVTESDSPSPTPPPVGEGLNPARIGTGSLSHRGRVGEGEPTMFMDSPQKQSQNMANSLHIPAHMFDCVADNLIENASNKQLREPGINITVKLSCDPLLFSVTDSGSVIPAKLAQRLIRTMLPSEDGLGVGLYQAARWAQQLGYLLLLSENHAGVVRFELAQADSSQLRLL